MGVCAAGRPHQRSSVHGRLAPDVRDMQRVQRRRPVRDVRLTACDVHQLADRHAPPGRRLLIRTSTENELIPDLFSPYTFHRIYSVTENT